MTRMSKQGERRAVSHRRRRPISLKTGPKRDALEFGYRPHTNTVLGAQTPDRFIPKITR